MSDVEIKKRGKLLAKDFKQHPAARLVMGL